MKAKNHFEDLHTITIPTIAPIIGIADLGHVIAAHNPKKPPPNAPSPVPILIIHNL